VIADARRFCPKVESVALVPNPIHVGDRVSLRVTLADGTDVDSLVTRMDETDRILDYEEEVDPLTTVYTAAQAGQCRVDVLLADRKTLLSPVLSVPIEVLP
jgi:hypothetical protein